MLANVPPSNLGGLEFHSSQHVILPLEASHGARSLAFFSDVVAHDAKGFDLFLMYTSCMFDDLLLVFSRYELWLPWCKKGILTRASTATVWPALCETI